jgi:hypothetical protein
VQLPVVLDAEVAQRHRAAVEGHQRHQREGQLIGQHLLAKAEQVGGLAVAGVGQPAHIVTEGGQRAIGVLAGSGAEGQRVPARLERQRGDHRGPREGGQRGEEVAAAEGVDHLAGQLGRDHPGQERHRPVRPAPLPAGQQAAQRLTVAVDGRGGQGRRERGGWLDGAARRGAEEEPRLVREVVGGGRGGEGEQEGESRGGHHGSLT